MDPCYYIETYLKSYNHLLKPMSGSNGWPTTDLPIMLPPLTKRLAGRPKRCRRKDPTEEKKHTGKISRKGTPMMCSKCKQYGHNKAGCNNTPAQAQHGLEAQHTAKRPKLSVKRKQGGTVGDRSGTQSGYSTAADGGQ